ncbi:MULTISPECIES: hypothetical protein [Paenibacillus]|uniref:Tail fiber domain-containing protein n=1 Tax=Paenibacillus odorifer TaxID=189426 RepID=A0ABX3HV69_9BACL|nr:hypothetical protein [Paenibacillus odorifer]OMD55254.1 hypothetical protein BSK51_04165 [Paenibacillus odorifer]
MAATIGNGVVDYNTAEAEAKKKLVANQLKINNDPNYVASEQQRALQVIAQRQAQGLDTTGQQKYLTQQLGYKAPAANTAAASTPTAASSTPKNNTQQGSEYLEQMKAIANRTITPYSYNPDADPAYQAALKRAAANIETGNSQAQAEMNKRGILNSTITSDRMGEIASQEMGNVETNIVPQLMQADYQRYLDRINQEQQQFSNLGSLANTSFSEDQRAIDNTNTRAGLTGYLSGGEEAQGLVSQLLNLKQQAETKGITAAERNKLSNQADGIRAMLSQMGVDASQYAAGVNYNTASQVTPNIRTLAGQESDRAANAQTFNQNLATRQQDTSEKQYNESFAYQKARDAISDKQWKTKFDEDVRQYGLNYGLQSLAQENDQSYRQAQLALSQDDNYRAWTQLDYETSQPQTTKYSGLTANQVLNNIKSLYQEPIMTETVDPLTKKVTQTASGKTKLTTDPAKLTQMFESVISAGLSETETKQILLSLGMSMKDIEARAKSYSGN